MRPEGVADRDLGQIGGRDRILVQRADVVGLGEGVEHQFPVEIKGRFTRSDLDVALQPIGSDFNLGAGQGAVGGQTSAALGLGEDQAIALGDRDRQQVAVGLGHVVEGGLGIGPRHQGSVQVIDPAVVGAAEARPSGSITRHDGRAAMAAGVDKALQRAVGLAHNGDLHAAQIGGQAGAGLRAITAEAQQLRPAPEQSVQLDRETRGIGVVSRRIVQTGRRQRPRLMRVATLQPAKQLNLAFVAHGVGVPDRGVYCGDPTPKNPCRRGSNLRSRGRYPAPRGAGSQPRHTATA